ncbi:unnamed protein product [Prorocentrum cordatum]|uniref:Uncharacterized protein n=1 Tax=Prorocentrum cordatum TaxID=2364126 RepID=A0ABN9RQC7_9DINO|nr:unnamed protein product [Polarella glacialis]
MGASACSCTLPPEAPHAAEDAASPKVGPQAQPALLRARSFTESTGESLARTSPGPSSEASPRSQDSASTEASCQSEPQGASCPGPAASGLPPSAAEPAQQPTSVARQSEQALALCATVMAARSDFSGDWLLHRLEGDVEALLRELETPWVQRKAAARLGYGVGMQCVRVEHHADQIRIHTSYVSGNVEMARPKPTLNVYNTDGIEQDVTDYEGHPVRTRVTWDGDALSMVSQRVGQGSGGPLPSTRRYLQGGGAGLRADEPDHGRRRAAGLPAPGGPEPRRGRPVRAPRHGLLSAARRRRGSFLRVADEWGGVVGSLLSKFGHVPPGPPFVPLHSPHCGSWPWEVQAYPCSSKVSWARDRGPTVSL